jgi:peroxiredoxin
MMLETLPEVHLQDFDGNTYSTAQLKGKKALIFMWASWWRCRNQLPGWQEFYETVKDENFEILSVAVDLQGPEVVKPYVEGTTFRTVVDTENKLSSIFRFKIVPNGIFVDEEGTIRLVKQGFKVNEETHLDAIRQLLDEKAEKVELEDSYYSPPTQVEQMQTQLAETKYKLGLQYLKNEQKEEALTELDEALRYDPDNFLIRKQRWYIRYPEKFAGTIDTDWQQTLLKQEREEEAKKNGEIECGPEGCKIPGTNQ